MLRLNAMLLLLLFEASAFAQRATPSDIYGDGVAPGVDGLSTIVLVLVGLALVWGVAVSKEIRGLVFGYLGMIVGTVGAGAILVEVFGKQTGLTIFVAIAVLTFWIWERKK
jgi:hypothetical protein